MTFKMLHVLTIGFFALAAGRNYRTVGNANRHANTFRCPTEGFHPDPFDCRIFYRCVDWNSNSFFRDFGKPLLAAFQFTCGEGTVYDPNYNVCSHPGENSRRECGGGRANSDGGGQNYPFAYSSGENSGQAPSYEGSTRDPDTGHNGGYPMNFVKQMIPDSDPVETFEDCSSDGFFPVPGDCKRFVRCTDDGMGGYRKFVFRCGEGTVWDQRNMICNFPSAVPGCGGMGQTTSENQVSGTQDNSGSYPMEENGGGGGAPEVSYPGQGNEPNQPEYPEDGNPIGYPAPAPDQSGYPQSGNQGHPGWYPDNQEKPGNQAHQQGNQNGYGPESNYPDFYPSQGTYPGQQPRPTYPQSDYTPSGNYQSHGYPEQSLSPSDESGHPNNQGNVPGQSGTGYEPTEHGNGQSQQTSTECQSHGFFSVPGDCTKFYRCVDNGKGGYFRYNFNCGPGTVWDQELTTCNHPWAVQRRDCSVTDTTTESGMDTSRSTTIQQSTSGQAWSETSSSSSSWENTSFFTQTSSSSSTFMTSSSFSSGQNQQTTSSQTEQLGENNMPGSQETSLGFQQTGMTTPMSPDTTPTTMPDGTTNSQGVSTSGPAGSRPCQPGMQPPRTKCEKSGYYPYPGDCKKFYRCVDWDGDKGERFSVYFFECGDGTIWDPALETCNHAESVYPPRDCMSSQNGTAATTKPKPPTTDSNMGMTDSTEMTTPGQTDTTIEEQRPTSTESSTEATTASSTTITREPEQTSTTDTPAETDQTNEPTGRPTESTPDNESATTDSTSTESMSQTGPTSERPENPSENNPDCPDLDENQVAFVCPTGFRRHPKDCNLFYQCTISKEGDVNVMTLQCKNNTLYDSRKIQCLPPDETDPCPMKQGRRTRFTRRVETGMTAVVPVASSGSLCPGEGNFPYQGDCQRFFKCQKDASGKLQGYLYQCPPKFSFSESVRTCERSSTQPKCSRSLQYLTAVSLKWMTSKVPVEYDENGSDVR